MAKDYVDILSHLLKELLFNTSKKNAHHFTAKIYDLFIGLLSNTNEEYAHVQQWHNDGMDYDCHSPNDFQEDSG